MSELIHAIQLGTRCVGPGQPVFVIAELSGNHGQNFEQAVELVRAAKECGADAIKLQTYTPDTLTIDCRNQYFQLGEGTIWQGKNLYELYGEAHTPWEWQPKLKEIANDQGLELFSTPFDSSAVDFLEDMDVPAYKIASFEIVDLALLRRVAETGKPVVVSTGMATQHEIHEAVSTLRDVGNTELALLKCTSAYPAPAEEMNLLTIPALRQMFEVTVGLSDHTLGIAAPIAAVTLGASIIEKHLTITRSAGGPDSPFSLEPNEFRQMVSAIRETEKALGQFFLGATEHEVSSRVFRRSLFVVDNMKAGDIFTERNVRSIRPGHGLPPRDMEQILGCRASCEIARGTPLSWSLVTATKSRTA